MLTHKNIVGYHTVARMYFVLEKLSNTQENILKSISLYISLYKIFGIIIIL